ncbi:Threonine/homoserine efflux transporter RhtA [Chitinophaga sp. CF118]|uniref:EamA family transporter n=1 Tax=Chitinophaga sp. CF118 TaxID=1884367 RepID=UPI0008EDD845|nr:DMT family transporter [Chitinophaga sp. CF118]SFD26482.1 Threonine/homoserine efflux transporter RhtA [Chitinophaga sp. CF118]
MIKYIIMVFAGACSFGILSTFVKLAYHEGYSTAEITFSQALIGMLVLWLLNCFQRKSNQPRINGKTWLSLLLTGAAIGLTTFVYYVSVHYIPASLAIVILMQFTWMGALLEWIFFKKKPGWIQVFIMLVIIGATVMASGLINAPVSLTGILYALGSAFLYAIYIVINSRTIEHISPLRKSAIIMTGSTLIILVVNMHVLLSNNHFDWNLLRWALFFGLFGTIIPQALFARGIPKVGAGISAIIMTVELPVAVITAHVVLKEPVGLIQWAGIMIMLSAIVLMNIRALK